MNIMKFEVKMEIELDASDVEDAKDIIQRTMAILQNTRTNDWLGFDILEIKEVKNE